MIPLWLSEKLGSALSVQTTIVLGLIIEAVVTCIFFNIKTPRRKGFFWILPCYILGLLALTIPFAMLRLKVNEFNRILCGTLHSFFGSFVILGLILLCYKQKPYDSILDFIASNAAMILAGKVFSLMLNMAGKDTSTSMSFFDDINQGRDWAIYWGVHVALYFLLGLVFAVRREITISKSVRRNVILLTVISLIIMNVLFSVSSPYEGESLALTIVVKAFAILICLFILMMRSGLLLQSQKENEADLMQDLFLQEKQQFDSCRASIDVINRKTHDLRHQLSSLQGKISESEMQELKEATHIYDSTIQTGNEILDAILYEKQLMMEKNRIRFTCLCDGKAISFMKQEHLYSLMNNIFSNAIEATTQLDEGRIIDLSIQKKKGFIILEEVNTCKSDISFDEKGLPISKKNDGKNHGFGTKNISYIVNEYHGQLKYQTKDNTFRILIYFPIQNA